MHKTQKAAGQNTQLLTDLLTRPTGKGETARDTDDARRGLRLVSKTRWNVGDRETRVVWLITQRRATADSSVGVRSYRVSLTATVTATSAAANGLRQPSTTHYSRTM